MENYKFVLFVNGEPVGYDDHPSPLLQHHERSCSPKFNSGNSLSNGQIDSFIVVVFFLFV